MLQCASQNTMLKLSRMQLIGNRSESEGLRRWSGPPGHAPDVRKALDQGFYDESDLDRKAGISDYKAFAKQVLAAIPDRPISFEVFSDEFPEMERQAREIATWGSNVYVKIPITNTRAESSANLCRKLAGGGLKLNVTALMTLDQVRDISKALAGGPPSCVSVFAGRVADTGVDPVPLMTEAVAILAPTRIWN